MKNLDFKFMAISDYLNSISDYFDSFDFYQEEEEELDDTGFMIDQLDGDMLAN